MSDLIMQNKDDDKEEKINTKWKMRISSLCSCLVTNKQTKNENEELKQRIKELESCSVEKQGAPQESQTYQVSNRDQVISEMSPRPPQAIVNITVDKAASSSPFQGKLGRRNVQLIRPERPKSYPYSIGDHNVIGIKDDVNKLVQQLTNPQSQLINPHSANFLAIVGMGGSGKTTLARHIYNHQEINQYFDCRAWICVSRVWNQECVLKDILSQTTGRNSNNLSVTQMVQEIHKLLEDKSYLVVLDDVWDQDALRKILVPIAKSYGSKFVITTRNQKIIQFSDLVFSKHEPRRLTSKQSLQLFKNIAFGHQSNTVITRNDSFVDLAKDMLKKCDGLPLAVISLAGLLRTKKTIQEWMKVGKNVCSKIIEDHAGPSDYGRVEDILGLSYSELNHTLKSCFMYLSLFPEDAEIPCGMLMRCWIAEGFFKSMWLAPNETIEDLARQYLDELIQRCLVQVVKVNYAEFARAIRVHDLLRDLAVKKATEKYFSHTFPSSSSPKSTMQFLRLGISCNNYRDLEEALEDLGLCSNQNLSPMLNKDKVSRRLRSFVLYYPYYQKNIKLRTLFTNYRLLRVLILNSGKYDMPYAIGSLIHLRYLQLSFRYIDYVPISIQNLRNLLSFDYGIEDKISKSWNIPSLEQMKELRYLRLPWRVKTINYLPWDTTHYENKPLNLHHLRNLKVLWGIGSGKWIMTELKYLSPSIEKLGITNIENSKQLEQVYQCPSIVKDNLYVLSLSWVCSEAEFELQKLQHCTNLQKLYLGGLIAATGVPFVFPPFLLKLQLHGSKLNDQDSFAQALQRLNYLKVLKLDHSAYAGVELAFPSNSLLNLEKLHLYELPEIERIHVMEGAMPYIMSFHVYGCCNLRVIQVLEGGMPHLKYFQVDKYFKLEAIPQSLRHLVKIVGWQANID